MKSEDLSILNLWNKYYKVKSFTLDKEKEKKETRLVLTEHKKDLKEFTFVSIVKFILTEGEKFIIFAYNDFGLDV